MRLFSRIVLFLFLAAPYSVVSADESSMKRALNSFLPQAEVDTLKPSEVPGFYEATIGANLFYVSEDGRYVLQGPIYDTETKKNISESRMAEVRKIALDKIGVENMIVFKPESSKHQVSIFTDIDCGYCRKLHSEIDQYMAQGITIRYLFFPRAGKGSESYKKAISVWCSADKNKALTIAKRGGPLEGKACDNPVDEHMELGEEFGMTGTPMIITEKGNLLPGYVPAQQLAKILDRE